jgi:DNA invertase Pin-like site-specific DNA recombinase
VELVKYGPKGDGWIEDDGVSGTLLAGRAWGQLLEDLRRGALKVDRIVVYNLSRISRVDRSSRDREKQIQSAEDAAKIATILRTSGVQVIDEGGLKDPSTLAFVLDMEIGNRQHETILKTTIGGKSSRLERGQAAMAGKVPYGYRRVKTDDGKKIEVEPTEAANLVKILNWYCDGGDKDGGETYAVRMVSEANIPIPRWTRKLTKPRTWWRPTTVRTLVLRARCYAEGVIEGSFAGRPYKVPAPKLIPVSLYLRVEERRKKKTIKHRATSITTANLRCACGSLIHTRTSSKYAHTRCNECKKSIRLSEFERHLYASLICRLIQIQMAPPPAQAKDHGERLADARKRLDTVAAKIEKLLDLHLEGGLDRETWQMRNEKLNAEKVSILGEMERIRRDEADAAKRQGQEVEVVARIAGTIRALMVIDREDPEGLATVRTILGELLGGERLTVRWDTSEDGRTVPLMTWPAWRSLPAITVRMTERQWPQMLPDHTPDVVPSWDP